MEEEVVVVKIKTERKVVVVEEGSSSNVQPQSPPKQAIPLQRRPQQSQKPQLRPHQRQQQSLFQSQSWIQNLSWKKLRFKKRILVTTWYAACGAPYNNMLAYKFAFVFHTQQEVIEQLDTVTKTLSQHLDTAEKLSKALSSKQSGDTSQLHEMTAQVRELATQVSRLSEHADNKRQGFLRYCTHGGCMT